MAWRKPNEGLSYTNKGKKDSDGGRMAHFFVTVTFNEGIKYHEKLIGERFAEFIKDNFLKILNRTANSSTRLFLQDSDPRQVCQAAKNTMEEVGFQMFAIPVCSPDLNPLKNMFHLINWKFREDPLFNEINKETFEQFVQGVKITIKELSNNRQIIDKTIESMNKRMKKILTTRG